MKSNPIGRTFITLALIVGLLALTGCASGEQTFTGTVEKTDKGLVLKTDDGANTYRLVENKELYALEGKSVKLTGSLMERESGKTIAVTRFEIVGGETAEGGAQKPAASD
jgi:hypothetical protein